MERLLSVHQEDPRSDLRTLKKLAAWAERYSPIIGLEEDARPQCLFLDITGCAGCFHGEDRLVQRALGEFRAQGWVTQIAISDTVGAAWGLAHHIHDSYVAPPGETERTLLPLPVAALRLPEETLQTLAELGIERVSQLMELPRAGLPGRFGLLVLERLDQALGRLPEPIVPCRFRPEVQVRCSFEYPTERREVLHQAIDHLLERIVALLRERHRGAKHLECWFNHEAARPVRIDVRLFRPSRSAAHMGKLLRTQMEHVRLEEMVSGIRLRVPVVEVMPERQFELFEADEPCAEEFAALIDRLVGRLGSDAVTFPRLIPDPQPEYACRFEPAIGGGRRVESGARRVKRGAQSAERSPVKRSALRALRSTLHSPRRPLQLLPLPEPIEVPAIALDGSPARVRRGSREYVIRRCWGPERIETGWWRGRDVQRDYYIVETAAGMRWWIFRGCEDGGWFLHGCFD